MSPFFKRLIIIQNEFFEKVKMHKVSCKVGLGVGR